MSSVDVSLVSVSQCLFSIFFRKCMYLYNRSNNEQKYIFENVVKVEFVEIYLLTNVSVNAHLKIETSNTVVGRFSHVSVNFRMYVKYVGVLELFYGSSFNLSESVRSG